jgi:transcriptional regulator with XRE-family HTH domain
MNHFGNLIRAKREEKKLLLRHLAAKLDIDTAYLSKMERGERRPRREQVIQLIEIFSLDHDTTMALWLADQVYDLVADEKQADRALKLAEKEITYRKKNK